MSHVQAEYSIILSHDTMKQIEEYTTLLNQGGTCGINLARSLNNSKLKKLDKSQLLSALINSKEPQIFAESDIVGDGTDWTLKELSILGDISIGMTVTIFDNGAHQHPLVHSTPFTGHLIYTPGALLRNDRGHVPADWEAVTLENE